MEEIIVKFSNCDIEKELNDIGFDKSYLKNAVNTYKSKTIKIKNLKPAEANILKQICLSLGFDCAVSRDTVTCKCEYTDSIIHANKKGYKKLIDKLKNQPFRLNEIANKIESSINDTLEPLYIKGTVFDWSRPYIMGILNCTPDSFSDGGIFYDKDSALKQAIKLIDDGADIIDIGGESTRPNANPVSVEEEIKRVIPVIKAIRNENISITISVDTRNYLTAKEAIEAGADIINDVSGFDYDNKLLNYTCNNNIPSIIMHSNKVPAVSSDCTTSDIVEDIYISLYKKIEKMTQLGMNKSNIIADTGIGFGKSKEACFEILRRHNEFSSLNVPMLLGISRKSFIRNQFNIDCSEADIPTALYTALLCTKKAHIHRVHNVKLTKQYIDYCRKLYQ